MSRTWTRPRLQHLLLKLADNLGEPTQEGTVIRVPVTHETLANMIGASRVRVTSTLNQLQREGFVVKRGRFLVVRTEKLKGAMAETAGE
jgi:CRP-like cAMP-binding protein